MKDVVHKTLRGLYSTLMAAGWVWLGISPSDPALRPAVAEVRYPGTGLRFLMLLVRLHVEWVEGRTQDGLPPRSGPRVGEFVTFTPHSS